MRQRGWGLLRTASLALLLALPASAPADEATPNVTSTELKEVAVEHQSDATIIHVTTSGPAKYRAEFMDSPNRLVVDLEDTVYAWRKTPLPVGQATVKEIRGSQYKKGVARLVLEFTRKVGYAIREDEDGLTIIVPTVVPPVPAAAQAVPQTSAKPAPEEPADPPAVATT